MFKYRISFFPNNFSCDIDFTKNEFHWIQLLIITIFEIFQGCFEAVTRKPFGRNGIHKGPGIWSPHRNAQARVFDLELPRVYRTHHFESS